MAADESISVEVTDGVDKSIARNLSEISSQARGAYQNVSKLVAQLNRVKPTAIAQFNSVVTNAQRQMSNAAMSAQKLATEQERTAAAATNAATAEQRLASATAQAERAQTNAAGAAMRLEAAQGRAAAAADRQSAATARAAAAAAAQTRSLAANEIEVNRIQGVHDRFNAVMARNPKYSNAMATGLGGVAAKSGLARHELQNLSFQVNDIAVGFASGQKPMTIFMQQGAQIGQIFGASGVGLGAILRQLGAIVGSVLLKFLPFALVIGTVAAAFGLFTRDFNKGLDSKKLLNDLHLTEEQLKRLKKSGEEISITFGDTFKATFQVIGRYAAEFLKPVTDKLQQWWGTSLDSITDFISLFVRAGLGMFLGFGNAIKTVWNNIPGAIELSFKLHINGMIALLESGLNVMVTALGSSPMGKFFGLNGVSVIKIPRLELSDNAKSVQTDLESAFDKGFAKADKLVDKFGKDVKAQAIKNAQARILKAAGDPPKDHKSGGFDRAKELAAINSELDSQAKNTFLLSTARDAANRVDEIALRFAKEKQPLTQKEIDGLRTKIQALNDAKIVQQQFDRIYQQATGPQRDYNASLEAANKLLKMGAITQAQYTAETLRAKQAHSEATITFFNENKELDEQIKLLKMLPMQREVEQQVIQAVNAAITAGKPINDAEIKQLREKLQLVQQLNISSQIQADMLANSAAQRSTNMQNETNTAIGLTQDPNANFTGADAVSQLGANNPALQATQEFSQANLAIYQDMYAQVEALRQADIISESSAAMAKFMIWQQQSQNTVNAVSGMLGNLAQMRNSDNKKASAIGKKAAIAQAIMNTYEGATAAFTSAAKIPYVGWILAPIAAAAAVAGGMAQVQQIRSQGYKQGGYTGDFGVNKEVGPVHGREFVMDAPATARIGKADLEALRHGAARVQRNSDGAGRAMAAPGAAGGSGPSMGPVIVPAPSIKMINVKSMDEARDFANSEENEKVVLNVLAKNGLL